MGTEELICSQQNQGPTLVPGTCNAFYQCAWGVATAIQYCPGSLLFNPELSVCDWDYNVDCTGQAPTESPAEESTEELTCSQQNQGPTLVPGTCNAFYQCAWGAATAIQYCPEPLLFNPELSVCDWDYNVDCQVTTTQEPTEAPTEEPTEAPTEAPTETPTATPTEAPTEAPTD